MIGRGRALKLFLTARSISAAEALEIGLVSSVTEDPLAIARSIACGSIA
jgi:enoyl-CoA hydratase/carnithine racemase